MGYDSDFLPIIVSLGEEQKRIYTKIAASFSQIPPVYFDGTVETADDKQQLAFAIDNIVGDKNALIIGQKHYCMTFCHDGLPAIIFDAHNDSYFDDERAFSDGSFLLYRNGDMNILGTDISSPPGKIKTYSPKKMDKILLNIPNEFLLSLDIDVLESRATLAHGYPRSKYAFLNKGISVDRLFRLTENILERGLPSAINIAGYTPSRDLREYPTAELLIDYLALIKGYFIPEYK